MDLSVKLAILSAAFSEQERSKIIIIMKFFKTVFTRHIYVGDHVQIHLLAPLKYSSLGFCTMVLKCSLFTSLEKILVNTDIENATAI